jgi:F0F1-type ATP synthase membrane subunit b/b'
MTERGETRAATQRQADALVAQARTETLARIDAGLAEQRQAMKKAQAELDAAAAPLATAIADKLVRG